MQVANKMIFAAALVSVALVQINGRPADSDWAAPFEAALKNLTSKFTEVVGDPTEYTNIAKNGLNTFADNLKSDLSTLSKTFEGKAGVSDVVKEATKQWQSAVDSASKNLPEELTNVQKFNEKFESTLKSITQNATELSKKAQGNMEVDKEIRDFTKKQIDALMEQVKSIQSKFTEKKA